MQGLFILVTTAWVFLLPHVGRNTNLDGLPWEFGFKWGTDLQLPLLGSWQALKCPQLQRPCPPCLHHLPLFASQQSALCQTTEGEDASGMSYFPDPLGNSHQRSPHVPRQNNNIKWPGSQCATEDLSLDSVGGPAPCSTCLLCLPSAQ